MPGSLSLNGTWQVSWTEGLHGRSGHPGTEAIDEKRFISLEVPCEVHRALEGAGLLDDPNVGINSLKARWVEEQVWLYRRTFEVPQEALFEPAWLVFEGLDLAATIWLNGEQIAQHKNAHRPCRVPVTGKLRKGGNELFVSVESGLYDVADREGSAYASAPETLLNKRHWLRKAQYQAGWDWNPRLINVGIVGDVRLEWNAGPWIEHLVVLPELADDHTRAILKVRAIIHNPGPEPFKGVLQAAAAETEGHRVKRGQADFEAPAGESVQELALEIEHPRLWWPIGHGSQSLYKVVATLVVDGQTVAEKRTRTGVRKVEIDRSPHPETGEYFVLKVNGRPIFCKGGNWVPPDMIVPGVENERYRKLVDLAVESNCNLLRVWGGGYYVNETLLDLCDERGLLLWHDLAFACAKYPGDDPAFLASVREEVRWNVRRMANHPSLAVWCGNNELEWGAFAWGYANSGRALPDYALYHHVIPVVLRDEDRSRPYWPSSPFSPDHIFPNEPTVGDQHPWEVTLGRFGADFWAYRQFVDRFPNEGGVLGASSPATLRQCLGDDFAFRSFAWEHHDNAANFWRSEEGITYRAVRLWLGHDAAKMDLGEYCFASALLQAEGLGEYIDNYRRRMFSSSSAIFWMYNDSWPATHGWTIVDYYLRRKLCFHPVRRAFQPVRVVVAQDGDTVKVFGVNDTPDAWSGVLRFGVFKLEGGTPSDETCSVTLPANSSVALAEIPRSKWERAGLKRTGAFAVLLDADDQVVSQHRLFLARFCDLKLAAPQVTVTVANGWATFASDQFAWGVCLDEDGERPLSDNCFDLLPGVPYRIPWDRAWGSPQVLRLGNDLLKARPSRRR
jgi:beta-mannosidase